MKHIAILLLAVAFSSGCAQHYSSSRDVETTKYRKFDQHAIGVGSVYIMTKSHFSDAYPSPKEEAAIRGSRSGFSSHGYEIAEEISGADYVFMCMWGIKDGGVHGYHLSGNTVSANRHFVHLMDGGLYAVEEGKPGSKLWEGTLIKALGHTKINPESMAAALLKKFPN